MVEKWNLWRKIEGNIHVIKLGEEGMSSMVVILLSMARRSAMDVASTLKRWGNIL